MHTHDDDRSKMMLLVSHALREWRWNSLSDQVYAMRSLSVKDRRAAKPFEVTFTQVEKEEMDIVDRQLAMLWDIGTSLTYVETDRPNRIMRFQPEVMEDLLKIREEALRHLMHKMLMNMKGFTDSDAVRTGAIGELLHYCGGGANAARELNDVLGKLAKELVLYTNDVHHEPEDMARAIQPLIGERRMPKRPYAPWTIVQASDTIQRYIHRHIHAMHNDPRIMNADALESCAANLEAYDAEVRNIHPVRRALESGRGRPRN
ncbi:MAG: hypothetical protein EB060_07525 [Proteobacteria bacterium]|nr:hypothetical protein [Pseudomonadota bacterium]